MVGVRAKMLVDSGGRVRATEQDCHGQEKREKGAHGEAASM